MWIVCLLSALVLTIFIIVLSKNKKETLLSVYKRAPYSLIVFVLSMYTIVISLNHTGVTYKMGELIANVAKSDTSLILAYGGLSALFDSFVNNIPMSILFSSVISTDFSFPALYATVIGSNIGAYLTPMASLAGIMWLSMLKKHEIEYSFAKFIKYGIILTPVILSCSLIGLIIIL
jgi:arsenical pump membrane protein